MDYTGIKQETKDLLGRRLQTALASALIGYAQSYDSHWSSRGITFYQNHVLLLDPIIDYFKESADLIAEYGVFLGHRALNDPDTISKYSVVKYKVGKDTKEQLTNVLEALRDFTVYMTDTSKIAEGDQYYCPGLVNLVGDIIQSGQKHILFLTKTLEYDSSFEQLVHNPTV
jgi:DNA-binding ferritin-like protein